MTPTKVLLALSLATVAFAFAGHRVSCDFNIGIVISLVAGAFAGASAGTAARRVEGFLLVPSVVIAVGLLVAAATWWLAFFGACSGL
jgi:ABC-type dipeptide/oligopeptide/nickel transport system permease subunit